MYQLLRKIKLFWEPFCFSRRKKVRTFSEVLSNVALRMFERHITKKTASYWDFENYHVFSQNYPCNFAVIHNIQAFWEILSNNTIWDAFYKFSDKICVFRKMLKLIPNNSSHFAKKPKFWTFWEFSGKNTVWDAI